MFLSFSHEFSARTTSESRDEEAHQKLNYSLSNDQYAYVGR
jgi:hypothetical protein